MIEITIETATHANQMGYTDVNPFEIVKKNTTRKLTIREMKCELVDMDKSFIPGGFLGNFINQETQKWAITTNEEGSIREIRLNKKGEWKDPLGNKYFIDNHPVKFYDYNF